MTNVYDGEERLTEQSFGSGIQRHNTYPGWVRAYSTDGLGNQMVYGYDAAGRLISRAEPVRLFSAPGLGTSGLDHSASQGRHVS